MIWVTSSAYCDYFLVSVLPHALVLVSLALAVVHIRKDYNSFLALGPGGTPQTWAGYARVKTLSLFRLWDQYAPIPIREDVVCKEGRLIDLPARQLPRPKTMGIAPHRQVEQRLDKFVFQKLASAIENLAPGHNNDLTIGTSCFEKHGTGLFSTSPATRTCRGEIVHAHPSDGSMHMTLHPADANAVLRAGWGERHPLAGVFRNRFLPKGFMMVYAPGNDEEIRVVLSIIEAACWYVSAGDAVQANKDGCETDSCTWSTPQGGSSFDNYLNKRQIEDPSKALEMI